MIDRCDNSDSCPVSLSNCLKKCCFDGFNASLVIGQRSNCNLHVCICNRNRIWYVWCIELRFTFSEEKKSKVHIVQDIYISKYFKELDRAIKLKIHIYHWERCSSEEKWSKLIESCIWRCFKGNIQITNLGITFGCYITPSVIFGDICKLSHLEFLKLFVEVGLQS